MAIDTKNHVGMTRHIAHEAPARIGDAWNTTCTIWANSMGRRLVKISQNRFSFYCSAQRATVVGRS